MYLQPLSNQSRNESDTNRCSSIAAHPGLIGAVLDAAHGAGVSSGLGGGLGGLPRRLPRRLPRLQHRLCAHMYGLGLSHLKKPPGMLFTAGCEIWRGKLQDVPLQLQLVAIHVCVGAPCSAISFWRAASRAAAARAWAARATCTMRRQMTCCDTFSSCSLQPIVVPTLSIRFPDLQRCSRQA